MFAWEGLTFHVIQSHLLHISVIYPAGEIQVIVGRSSVKFSCVRVFMDQNSALEEGECRIGVELVKSVSDKHLDLLRPSSRYYSIFKGQAVGSADKEKGKYTLIKDSDDFQPGLYDRPLPCFGCGIGWFSFLLGFICPLMWYYATVLYFGNYYRKDPRERAGLAASAIAAMASSVVLLIVVLILLL